MTLPVGVDDTGEANTVFNAVFSDVLFDGEHREITLNLRPIVNATRQNERGELLFKPGGTLQVYFYNLSKPTMTIRPPSTCTPRFKATPSPNLYKCIPT